MRRYNKQMKEMLAYGEWLQARQSTWNTSPDLIQEYVRKATGSAMVTANRLVLGIDNEVYDVTTAGKQEVIVRISRKDNHRFEAERWALDTARSVGVPTPHVLLIEQAAYDNHTVTFCIEEKISGRPLDMLLKQGMSSDLNKAIDHIGEVLSKLHSVNVDGFGYLQPDGKGSQIPFAQIMLDLNGSQDQLYEAAQRWNVPRHKITTSLKLLNEHRQLYQFDDPVLVHGDLGLLHIFVDGDHVSGLIDMQDCAGNHPIFDLAYWDAYCRERIPTSRIIASYGNQSIFMDSYDPLFHLVLLREALWMLIVDTARGNPHGIQGFIAEMERALIYFASKG